MTESKYPLSPKMEIAFYNVIDHRCDKMEAMNVPNDKIIESLSGYANKFIDSHEMTESKRKELQTFIETIISNYKD